MYAIVFTGAFVRHFKKLPHAVQLRADALTSLLAVDIRDSRLHTKKLHGIDVFSFRVGRDYRVLFMFVDGSTIKLLDIKHRGEIYKK